MGQSSEEYIQLCDEWVNMNPITGFQVKSRYDYYNAPDVLPGHYQTPKVVRRKVKKKTLPFGL